MLKELAEKSGKERFDESQQFLMQPLVERNRSGDPHLDAEKRRAASNVCFLFQDTRGAITLLEELERKGDSEREEAEVEVEVKVEAEVEVEETEIGKEEMSRQVEEQHRHHTTKTRPVDFANKMPRILQFIK